MLLFDNSDEAGAIPCQVAHSLQTTAAKSMEILTAKTIAPMLLPSIFC